MIWSMMNTAIVRIKRNVDECLRKGNRRSFLLAVAAAAVLSACGGGGGGGASAPPPSTSTTVNITGSLSSLAKAKPSADPASANRSASAIDWAAAVLQVVDASGVVIGTGTVHADGTYSVSVPPGSNYFIRVQAGNLLLKAFVPSVTASATVNVTPTTTAHVIVLAGVLGVANAGEPGVSVSTALSSVNVDAVVMQITANPNVAAVATMLAANIASS
ncbi:MAG: hypothetical protein EPO63_09255, partial [Candidatus Nitrosotenuis sp.]